MSNTPPQAIAGTGVISFSVTLPMYLSLPLTAGIACAYDYGAAEVAGWDHVTHVLAVYYMGLQWITSAMIRMMVLRVAAAVDQSRAERQAVELNRRVSDAVRNFEREQLALLHDTAASTLMMVGQGTPLPRKRLAAQARRDLELLSERPWATPPQRIELVAALHDCAKHRGPRRRGRHQRRTA